MLSSPDSSVVEMGMKLLTNYDISEYGFTIFTLFRLYHQNVYLNKCWNSVGIQQLRNTLSYEIPYDHRFPACVLGNTDCLKSLKITNEDREMASSLIVKFTDKYVSSYADDLMKQLSRYKVKINVSVTQ